MPTPPDDSGIIGSFGASQHSGTRLKIKYFEFDGARQVFEIYDSVRGSLCAFSQWNDGNSYCTPFDVGQVAFSDDKCTTQIGVGSRAPCTSYQSFAEYTVDCNGARTYSHLFPAGSQLALNQYFTLEGSICRPISGSGLPLYALGPEIGVADLVRGTIAPEGPGRIQARFITGSDGLRVSTTLAFDSLLGVNCSLQPSGQCIPTSTVPSLYFKDAACTTRAARIDNRCPRKLVAEPNSCTFRSLGTQIPTTLSYASAPSGCTQVPLAPNTSLFEIGAQVTLPTIARGPVDTGRRIRPIRFADLDISDDFRWFDSEKQTECLPEVLSDESVYCFPIGGTISTNYYSNPTCTTSIVVVAVAVTPRRCESPSVPTFAAKSGRDERTCVKFAESRQVGSVHNGQLYEKQVGSCMPASSSSTYYDVGPAIPLSELAKGAFITDK